MPAESPTFDEFMAQRDAPPSEGTFESFMQEGAADDMARAARERIDQAITARGLPASGRGAAMDAAVRPGPFQTAVRGLPAAQGTAMPPPEPVDPQGIERYPARQATWGETAGLAVSRGVDSMPLTGHFVRAGIGLGEEIRDWRLGRLRPGAVYDSAITDRMPEGSEWREGTQESGTQAWTRWGAEQALGLADPLLLGVGGLAGKAAKAVIGGRATAAAVAEGAPEAAARIMGQVATRAPAAQRATHAAQFGGLAAGVGVGAATRPGPEGLGARALSGAVGAGVVGAMGAGGALAPRLIPKTWPRLIEGGAARTIAKLGGEAGGGGAAAFGGGLLEGQTPEQAGVSALHAAALPLVFHAAGVAHRLAVNTVPGYRTVGRMGEKAANVREFRQDGSPVEQPGENVQPVGATPEMQEQIRTAQARLQVATNDTLGALGPVYREVANRTRIRLDRTKEAGNDAQTDPISDGPGRPITGFDIRVDPMTALEAGETELRRILAEELHHAKTLYDAARAPALSWARLKGTAIGAGTVGKPPQGALLWWEERRARRDQPNIPITPREAPPADQAAPVGGIPEWAADQTAAAKPKPEATPTTGEGGELSDADMLEISSMEREDSGIVNPPQPRAGKRVPKEPAATASATGAVPDGAKVTRDGQTFEALAGIWYAPKGGAIRGGYADVLNAEWAAKQRQAGLGHASQEESDWWERPERLTPAELAERPGELAKHQRALAEAAYYASTYGEGGEPSVTQVPIRRIAITSYGEGAYHGKAYGRGGYILADWLMDIRPDGTAYIHDITSAAGRGTLGTIGVEAIRRFIKAKHPEVKRFAGYRVSGASPEREATTGLAHASAEPSDAERRATGITVLNAKHLPRNWKEDPNKVYIGRPSKWGNPFKIGPDGTREEVIAKYKVWIQTQPDLMAQLGELKGKELVCWDKPLACHGDVLQDLVAASMRSAATPTQAPKKVPVQVKAAEPTAAAEKPLWAPQPKAARSLAPLPGGSPEEYQRRMDMADELRRTSAIGPLGLERPGLGASVAQEPRPGPWSVGEAMTGREGRFPVPVEEAPTEKPPKALAPAERTGRSESPFFQSDQARQLAQQGMLPSPGLPPAPSRAELTGKLTTAGGTRERIEAGRINPHTGERYSLAEMKAKEEARLLGFVPEEVPFPELEVKGKKEKGTRPLMTRPGETTASDIGRMAATTRERVEGELARTLGRKPTAAEVGAFMDQEVRTLMVRARTDAAARKQLEADTLPLVLKWAQDRNRSGGGTAQELAERFSIGGETLTSILNVSVEGQGEGYNPRRIDPKTKKPIRFSTYLYKALDRNWARRRGGEGRPVWELSQDQSMAAAEFLSKRAEMTDTLGRRPSDDEVGKQLGIGLKAVQNRLAWIRQSERQQLGLATEREVTGVDIPDFRRHGIPEGVASDLREGFKAMTGEERAVVTAIFRFDLPRTLPEGEAGPSGVRTPQEVAEMRGTTPERVRELLAQALSNARVAMEQAETRRVTGKLAWPTKSEEWAASERLSAQRERSQGAIDEGRAARDATQKAAQALYKKSTGQDWGTGEFAEIPGRATSRTEDARRIASRRSATPDELAEYGFGHASPAAPGPQKDSVLRRVWSATFGHSWDTFKNRVLPEHYRQGQEIGDAGARAVGADMSDLPTRMEQLVTSRVDRSLFEDKAFDLKLGSTLVVQQTQAAVVDAQNALAAAQHIATVAPPRLARKAANSVKKAADLLQELQDNASRVLQAYGGQQAYNAAIADPRVSQGIAKVDQFLSQPYMDPIYKRMLGMDPADVLSPRERDFARIHLLADDAAQKALSAAGATGSLYQTRSGVTKQMRGSLAGYETSFRKIVEQGFQRTLGPAAKVDYWRALLDAGKASFTPTPDHAAIIRGVQLPSRLLPPAMRRAQGQFGLVNMYVEPKLAEEIGQIHAAHPFDAPKTSLGLIPQAITTTQLAGFADFVTHFRTLGRGMTASYIEGASKGNILRATFHPIARLKAEWEWGKAGLDLLRKDTNALEMAADLGSVGIGRSGKEWSGLGETFANWLEGKGFTGSAKAMNILVKLAPSTWTSKLMHFLDTSGHVAMERQRLRLVKQGVYTDSIENKINFHAKMGMYARGFNRGWVNALRAHGMGQFIIAGKTQAVEGARRLIGASGSRAPDTSQAIANQIAGLWGTVAGGIVGAAALNYALHKDVFPEGVPPGEVLRSRDPNTGKVRTFDYMEFSGKERGMTNTGLRDALRAARAGQTPTQIASGIVDSLWETFSRPIVGPAPSMIQVALTGKTLLPRERRMARMAEPGESQAAINLLAAIHETNPTVAAWLNAPARGESRVRAAADPFAQAVGLRTRGPALSAASEEAREIVAARTPPRVPSAQNRLVRDYQESIRAAIRGGMTPDQAIRAVEIPEGVDAGRALRAWSNAKFDRAMVDFRMLSVDEARHVYRLANPQEREAWRGEYVAKEARAIVNDVGDRIRVALHARRTPNVTGRERMVEQRLSHLVASYRRARDANPRATPQIVREMVRLLPTEAQTLVSQ